MTTSVSGATDARLADLLLWPLVTLLPDPDFAAAALDEPDDVPPLFCAIELVVFAPLFPAAPEVAAAAAAAAVGVGVPDALCPALPPAAVAPSPPLGPCVRLHASKSSR